jgi:putative SOS response-associated peptidase YedK
MCGRFALYSSPARIGKQFAAVGELDLKPRFNITPAQTVPVIRADEAGNRFFAMARWGLIPSWVEDTDEFPQPINAKAETASIKPMFRHAYRNGRVLIPADAFYEWVSRNGKQPYLIKLRDDKLMGIGGLMEYWQGAETEVATFTILTTGANHLISRIHERMPVIIKPEDHAAWLDGSLTDVTRLITMTEPYPERLMEAYPVSREVNNPRHDAPDLIAPVTI